MNWRFIVIHVLVAMCTFVIVNALVDWAYSAWGLSAENFAKPWRGFFRLAFAGFIGVLLLGTQALVGRKFTFRE